MPKQYSVSKRSYRFGPAEVVAAVESLYADKVQPIGRILLKRVGERAAAASTSTATEEVGAGSIPRIDPKYLRSLCERCDQLTVESMGSGGEYSVLLAGRAATFVDASSANDPYPAKLWEELAAYFERLEGEAMFWPSGRFACAQALAAWGPSCLAYRSLGELVHIVQLCVGHKKILGYRGGHLVPYCHSELMEKEQCAICQQPVAASKGAAASMPLASWDQVRFGLAWLLARADYGSIQLPNVKRLFRSDLGLELSETTLGYARIFELLHDPRTSSICDLRLEGKNWMVVRKQVLEPLDFQSNAQPLEAGARQLEPLSGPAPAGFAMAAPIGVDADFTRRNFRCLSTSPLSTVAPAVATSPLQYATAAPPQLQTGGVKNFETASFASTFDPADGDLDSPRSTSGSSLPAFHGGACPNAEPVEMDFSFTVRNTFIEMVPSHSSQRRSKSVPRCMGLGRTGDGALETLLAFGEFPPESE
jgi:hypothetical protein